MVARLLWAGAHQSKRDIEVRLARALRRKPYHKKPYLATAEIRIKDTAAYPSITYAHGTDVRCFSSVKNEMERGGRRARAISLDASFTQQLLLLSANIERTLPQNTIEYARRRLISVTSFNIYSSNTNPTTSDFRLLKFSLKDFRANDRTGVYANIARSGREWPRRAAADLLAQGRRSRMKFVCLNSLSFPSPDGNGSLFSEHYCSEIVINEPEFRCCVVSTQ
ncbi:hypothetical protein EVAR_76344_1 [Eumeta japonica]|uniref:Uncharacterized protein n=1 Tax=Eumeta variegata TaxID=151549 RepID=A0A4C1T8L8_EUMVA|nr:hypothetical protein EVAR_76344_1 [Eumeta japonica]